MQGKVSDVVFLDVAGVAGPNHTSGLTIIRIEGVLGISSILKILLMPLMVDEIELALQGVPFPTVVGGITHVGLAVVAVTIVLAGVAGRRG